MPTIKSIGRKDTNFGQLINYLHKEDGGEKESCTLVQNMDASPDDIHAIEQAFRANEVFRKKRKNGVGMYHEVISFHPEDTAILREHPHIIQDFSRMYMELRAPYALAIARPHFDKDHIHIHVMISPNEVGSSKNIRMSKKEFSAFRRTMEEYQLLYYPALKKSYVHSRDLGKYPSKDQAVEQQTDQERQMKKRGLTIHDKKELSSTVEAQLNNTQDLTEFQDILKAYNIETYQYQGRVMGVKYNGRKYRFSRLLKKDSSQMQVVHSWNAHLLHQEQENEHDKGLELDL